MVAESDRDLSTMYGRELPATTLDGAWHRVEGLVYNRGGQRPWLILGVPAAPWPQAGLPGPEHQVANSPEDR